MTTTSPKQIPSRDKYGDGTLTSPDIRVPGLRCGGTCTIGGTAEGSEGRQTFGGPMIPGPWIWGHANTHAAVIDNYGGSARTRAAAPLELAFGEPFTFEGIPGVYTLQAPQARLLDGDHPRVVAWEAPGPAPEFESQVESEVLSADGYAEAQAS